MKTNMGTLDRVVRILLSVGIALLYATGILSGTWAIIAGVIAVIFLLTSLIGFCPLYRLVGMTTCKRKT